MKLGDLPLGLLACLFGSAVIFEAARFPVMAGMAYGPEFFPTIVGTGFCICGLLLVSGDLRARLTGSRPELFAVEPALQSRRALLRAFAVLVTVVLFVLLVKPLGFLLTLSLLMLFLLRSLAAGWLVSFVIAVLLPFALHFCFTGLLRVPLPRGVVESLLF